MTLSFKTLAASTTLVLAASAAFGVLAQTATIPSTAASTPRAGTGMKALDTNNDKMISRDEAKRKPRLTKNFDAIDTNKDGQLSRDEIKAYRKARKDQGKVKS